MTKSIVITLPHDLTAAEAKRRIAEGMESLRTTYLDKLAASEVTWTGDRAAIMVKALGQTVDAEIHVLADAVRIEVRLPFILAALGNRVRGVLTTSASDSLKIEHKPPKP
jgi:dihydroxyacetone kinase